MRRHLLAATLACTLLGVPHFRAEAAIPCVINGVTYYVTITGTGTITGTPGNDVIAGSNAADTINGLGGNDVICGRGGSDKIDGGDGGDRIAGDTGLDTIKGGL